MSHVTGAYRVDQVEPYGTQGFDTSAPSAPTELDAPSAGSPSGTRTLAYDDRMLAFFLERSHLRPLTRW